MARKRRVILPWVVSAFALGVVGYCLYLGASGKRPGSNGVVIDGNIVYSTRPLRPEEIKPLLTVPVPFPAAARDFQFADYGEWLAAECYFSFRAPPDICVAYAHKVLQEHNRQHPDEPVPA